jgi:hypothetical protein
MTVVSLHYNAGCRSSLRRFTALSLVYHSPCIACMFSLFNLFTYISIYSLLARAASKPRIENIPGASLQWLRISAHRLHLDDRKVMILGVVLSLTCESSKNLQIAVGWGSNYPGMAYNCGALHSSNACAPICKPMAVIPCKRRGNAMLHKDPGTRNEL